jgi:hypothetical protein
MRTVKRHSGGKRRAKASKKNLSRSMPPIISVSKNGSITPYKSRTKMTATEAMSKASASRKSSKSRSKNNNVSLNVRNEAEADNALDIMKKSPITIVLVFANWCPHCHSYMETWNKLKGLPNRAPMVEMDAASDEPGAKQAVQEFLSSMKGPDGAPMEVNAFPTVLSVKNNKGSLEAEPVENSRDESAMEELLKNNASKFVEENMVASTSSAAVAATSAASPEEATKNVGNMDIPIVTAEESIRAANAALKASLSASTRVSGLTGIPKDTTAKPTEISQKALNAEDKKSESRPLNANVEENMYEEPVTPAFTEPPSSEVLDSGESTASRKAVAPGTQGGGANIRTGGSLYEALSTYSAGSPLLLAAAPAAILLAAQQTAARRARIGKPKTRKGGAKARKTRRRA